MRFLRRSARERGTRDGRSCPGRDGCPTTGATADHYDSADAGSRSISRSEADAEADAETDATTDAETCAPSAAITACADSGDTNRSTEPGRSASSGGDDTRREEDGETQGPSHRAKASRQATPSAAEAQGPGHGGRVRSAAQPDPCGVGRIRGNRIVADSDGSRACDRLFLGGSSSGEDGPVATGGNLRVGATGGSNCGRCRAVDGGSVDAHLDRIVT